MAVGLARLFGIRLPVNFFSPYKANNIIEFWRRWHISLSRFLRDYLYIPLGGGRAGIPARYRNILITMLLGGLWHGAGWTFMIWGGLHGLYICINHAWHYVKRRLGFPAVALGAWTWLPSRVLTFLAVTVAWVFFRADTLDGAMVMLEAMSSLGNLASPRQFLMAGNQSVFASFGPSFIFLLLYLLLGAVWYLPNTYQMMVRYQPAIDSYGHLNGTTASRSRLVWRMNWGWALATGFVAALAVFGMGNVSEFLYFRF
jgi:D-alanyl-lipoteichoic acid acyltransferase DltB (MBOAT superfamily)